MHFVLFLVRHSYLSLSFELLICFFVSFFIVLHGFFLVCLLLLFFFVRVVLKNTSCDVCLFAQILCRS